MKINQRYSIFSSFMHWVMALLIITLLAIGLWMGQTGDYQLMWTHKALGVIALVMIIIRIPARLLSTVAPHGHTLQHKAGRAVHFLMYLLMLTMPLSGIVMSWAGGRATDVFSLFTIPGAAEKIPELAGFANTVHTTVIYGLIALIALHILGFVYHQFIKKENVLRRISLMP